MEYLHSITGDVNYDMMARHHESHKIIVSEESMTDLLENSGMMLPYNDALAGITAIVLSKSTALSKVETDLELLSDEAESFINKLQGGSLNIGARKYSAIIARILRFEYESTVVINVLDRPAKAEADLLLRKAYDMLADYYELNDRYSVLDKKATELRSIGDSYSLLQYYRRERRLLLFEIFLLALFPLSYFLHDWLHHYGIEHISCIFPAKMLQKFNIFF